DRGGGVTAHRIGLAVRRAGGTAVVLAGLRGLDRGRGLASRTKCCVCCPAAGCVCVTYSVAALTVRTRLGHAGEPGQRAVLGACPGRPRDALGLAGRKIPRIRCGGRRPVLTTTGPRLTERVHTPDISGTGGVALPHTTSGLRGGHACLAVGR